MVWNSYSTRSVAQMSPPPRACWFRWHDGNLPRDQRRASKWSFLQSGFFFLICAGFNELIFRPFCLV